MKFGKQLRFVAVRGWEQNYIQYKQFKKLIKQFTTSIEEAAESNPDSIPGIKASALQTFTDALVENVNKIIKFYSEEITTANEKCDALSKDIYESVEQLECSDTLTTTYHKKIYTAYLHLYEIRTFLEINRSGVFNITKKFAKKLDFPESLSSFDPIRHEALDNQPSVEETLRRYDELYVIVRRNVNPLGDSRPRQEIILDINRQVENSLIWKQKTVVSKWDAYNFRLNEYATKSVTIKYHFIILGLILSIPFYVVSFIGNYTAQRCLGMIIFCATLWSTTAVPLWLTSLSIPFMATVLRLLPDTSVKTIAKEIQVGTMSSTVYLIIGGFTIAAGFKETEMDKRIAAMILSRSTGSPQIFVLSAILLNAFLAMWINNVASTMIVVTLVTPTLANIPTESNFAKAILIGIGIGGNLGGMMTPLASPQNALAIQAVEDVYALNPLIPQKNFGFVEFLLTAFPYALVCSFAFWAVLMLVLKMDVTNVPKFEKVETDFGWRQIVVTVTTVGSIVLWIVLPFGADTIFGDNGIIGFVPLIMFYGTGILQPSKLAQLPWNIIFLVMGGSALGKSVSGSGLLQLASDLLKKALGNQGLWVTLLIVCLFVMFINVFISHTVSSTILLPLVANFAANSPHLRMFAMQACMATTTSQILPVSSFPNLCCSSLQDRNGKEYLKTADVIKLGSMATVVCFVLLISLCYGLTYAVGL